MKVLAGLRERPTAAKKGDSAVNEPLEVGRGSGKEGDIIRILQSRDASTIHENRPNVRAVVLQVSRKAIKENAKKSGTKWTALLNTRKRRQNRTHPIPYLHHKLRVSIKRSQSCEHAALDAQTGEDLPKKWTVDMIIGRLQVQKAAVQRLACLGIGVNKVLEDKEGVQSGMGGPKASLGGSP